MIKPDTDLFSKEETELWLNMLEETIEYGVSVMRSYNITMRYLISIGIPGNKGLVEALLDDYIFWPLLEYHGCGEKTANHLKKARERLIEHCKKDGVLKIPDIRDLAKANPVLFKELKNMYRFFGWSCSGDKIQYETARRRKKLYENVS